MYAIVLGLVIDLKPYDIRISGSQRNQLAYYPFGILSVNRIRYVHILPRPEFVTGENLRVFHAKP